MGPAVRLIDSAEEAAHSLAEVLATEKLEAPVGTTPFHRFAVSDDEVRFRAVGGRFIGERLAGAEVVDLETDGVGTGPAAPGRRV